MNLVPLAAVVLAASLWMLGWSIYFTRCGHRLIHLRELWMTRFDGDAREQARRNDALVGRTAEVGRLIRGAGIPDGRIPFANPVGWGHVATGTAPLFDNWLVVGNDVPPAMENAFLRAIGVYDDRRRRALNPLWWVGLLVTAPQHLVRWLGGDGEGAAAKVATLVWAIVAGVGVLLGIVNNARTLLGP